MKNTYGSQVTLLRHCHLVRHQLEMGIINMTRSIELMREVGNGNNALLFCSIAYH
jgi:hypothetical protein